jgi:hypothetical protein
VVPLQKELPARPPARPPFFFFPKKMGKKRAIFSAGGLKSLAEKNVPGDEKSTARHRIIH